MERYLYGSVNADKAKACIEENYQYIGIRNKADWYSETVDANNINGIDLLGADIDSFWSQHRHTHDEYVEIASHIPEINARIELAEAEGKTREEALDVCRGIEELEPCVEVYYEKPVEVAALEDTYMATGDGRHRILAAQEVGVEMPVLVKGEYLNPNLENANIEEQAGLADEIAANQPDNVEGETMRNIADQAALPENAPSNGQEEGQAQERGNTMSM